MDTLHLLEEKIRLLVGHVKKFQDERATLLAEHEALKKEHDSVADQLSVTLQDNKRLQAKVKELQKVSAEGSKEREVLSSEREQALLAVDNLIRSIDGLIATDVAQ